MTPLTPDDKAWRAMPITESQVNLLIRLYPERWGTRDIYIMTKGQAADMVHTAANTGRQLSSPHSKEGDASKAMLWFSFFLLIYGCLLLTAVLSAIATCEVRQ